MAFALYALAASPSASPAIVTDTNSTASGNVTSAFTASQLFGYSTGGAL